MLRSPIGSVSPIAHVHAAAGSAVAVQDTDRYLDSVNSPAYHATVNGLSHVTATTGLSAAPRDVNGLAGLRVSIATTMYNEEAVAPEFLRQVGDVLHAISGGPHEIVVVDDGSSDDTLSLLQAAAASDPRIVVVALSRNFGHQAALSAALDHVTGDVAVVMDGDLQDAPSAIPVFLDQFAQGYDVVYAKRTARKEAWYLRLSYFLFYRLALRLSSIPLPVDAGDFSLLSRRVIQQLRKTPERQRYLRGLRTWVGFRQIGVPVERAHRFAGDSKYSPLKLLRLAFDGIFAFSIVPLRAAAATGLFAMVTAIIFALYSVYVRVALHRSPAGFTATILVVTFLSGVNLFFLGVIGEYVGRVYEEVKHRPLYVVSSVTRRALSGDPQRLDDSYRTDDRRRTPSDIGVGSPSR